MSRVRTPLGQNTLKRVTVAVPAAEAETLRRCGAVLRAGGMPARVLKDAAEGHIVGIAEIDPRAIKARANLDRARSRAAKP